MANLTQKDADKFKKSAKKYTETFTASKEIARKKLVELGINKMLDFRKGFE